MKLSEIQKYSAGEARTGEKQVRRTTLSEDGWKVEVEQMRLMLDIVNSKTKFKYEYYDFHSDMQAVLKPAGNKFIGDHFPSLVLYRKAPKKNLHYKVTYIPIDAYGNIGKSVDLNFEQAEDALPSFLKQLKIANDMGVIE